MVQIRLEMGPTPSNISTIQIILWIIHMTRITWAQWFSKPTRWTSHKSKKSIWRTKSAENETIFVKFAGIVLHPSRNFLIILTPAPANVSGNDTFSSFLGHFSKITTTIIGALRFKITKDGKMKSKLFWKMLQMVGL